MVFVFEIRKEDKSCDEIFVRFKVVNEGPGNEEGSVIQCLSVNPESNSAESEENNNNNKKNSATTTKKVVRKQQLKRCSMPCKDVYKLTANLAGEKSESERSCCRRRQGSGIATTAIAGQLDLIPGSTTSSEEEEDISNGKSTTNGSTDSSTGSDDDSGIGRYRAKVNSNNNGDGDSGENNVTTTAADTAPAASSLDGNGNQKYNNEVTILSTQAVSHAAGSVKVPAPALLPKTPNAMDLTLYLTRVQQYFDQLGYHRQGEPKIRVLTNLSIKHQIETAKSLIKAGEPIKCLHALVLAIHLTNCSNHVERFPINFKSEFNGKEYKHVVLGVYLYGMFGAVGISRDPGLQDKPAAYPRLLDLIMDYHRCYNESGHILQEVKIGGVITHDPHSVEPINWKVGSVSMDPLSSSVLENSLEKIAKQLRSKMGATCLRNVRPTQMVYPSLGEQPISPAQTPPIKTLPAKKSKTVTSISSATKKVMKK